MVNPIVENWPQCTAQQNLASLALFNPPMARKTLGELALKFGGDPLTLENLAALRKIYNL